MGFRPDLRTYTLNTTGEIGNIDADSAEAIGLRRASIPENLGKNQGPIFGEMPGNGMRYKVSITTIAGNACNLYAPGLDNVANKDAVYSHGVGVDKESIQVLFQSSNLSVERIQIFYFKTDGSFILDTFNVALQGNDFWFEILRNAARTVTTLRIFDADTFDVGDLLDTLIIAGTPATIFSEHYALIGQGSGGINSISGEVSGYDFTWLAAEGLSTNPLKSAIFGERGVLAA